MFDQYLQYAQEAKQKEIEINQKYDKLREELTIDLKKGTVNELSEIEKVLMKDYSPIKFHNMITTVVNKSKKLDEEKEKELQQNKELLDEKLAKIIEYTFPVKEMYKIISMSSQNDYYLCRVWFTLVPIEDWKCLPGDPIRIEWLHLPQNGTCRKNDQNDCISHTAKRNGPGIEGLKMPQFDNSGRVTGSNATYPLSQWGENSQQVKWWKEWLAANRPC